MKKQNKEIKVTGYYKSSGYFDRYELVTQYTLLKFKNDGTFSAMQLLGNNTLKPIAWGSFQKKESRILLSFNNTDSNSNSQWIGKILQNGLLFSEEDAFYCNGCEYHYHEASISTFTVLH